jgi:hypothetical protein
MYASSSNCALTAYMSTGQYASSTRLHAGLASEHRPSRKSLSSTKSVTLATSEESAAKRPPEMVWSGGGRDGNERPKSAPARPRVQSLSIELLHECAPREREPTRALRCAARVPLTSARVSPTLDARSDKKAAAAKAPPAPIDFTKMANPMKDANAIHKLTTPIAPQQISGQVGASLAPGGGSWQYFEPRRYMHSDGGVVDRNLLATKDFQGRPLKIGGGLEPRESPLPVERRPRLVLNASPDRAARRPSVRPQSAASILTVPPPPTSPGELLAMGMRLPLTKPPGADPWAAYLAQISDA